MCAFDAESMEVLSFFCHFPNLVDQKVIKIHFFTRIPTKFILAPYEDGMYLLDLSKKYTPLKIVHENQ